MSLQPSWITGDIFVSKIENKTLKAWEPWEYSRLLLFEFQNSEIDDEHPEWRLHWFSGVAILRTIGHVMHKIDAKTSPLHLSIIEQRWSDWKKDKAENWIFFDFIEKERNNILKEFSFGAEISPDGDDRALIYKGTDFDATQLFREAVYWWRYQLIDVESQIAK